jgi:HAE1 family hydrophobic/amphiphilic exporter-1
MERIQKSLLPRLSVMRPVTVTMVFVAFLVVGAIAYMQIPIKLLPSGFTPPFLGIWVNYPNSNPSEVEDKIARPLEEIVQTIRGVDLVETYSQNDGVWTWIEFDQETDMDLAYSTLRDRVERVKPELPDDVERIYLRKFTDDDEPIVFFSVTLNGNVDDPYYMAEKYIKRPLERIDGVAYVEIWGVYEKLIQIEIDHDKINAMNVDLYPVIQSLMNDNFNLSSGYVEDGGRKISVRSVAKYRNQEEIEDLRINGTGIRLGDVAKITYDIPEREFIQRINGHMAIKVGVFKESMANTVALSGEIVETIENEVALNPFFEGMEFEILFDQGNYILESINNLKSAGLWGGLFAVFILFFFLRRIRMTLIILLAIPLSLLLTVTCLYFMGWSLNVITMMGLMVSVGLVVDNSIVIVENIYRLKRKGLTLKEAAVSGASEVALAVTMATLTTVVVFLPLILINDDVGFSWYMFRIGLPVIVALVASLLVALLFIPFGVTKITSRESPKKTGFIEKIRIYYDRALKWTLNHRIDATFIAILLLASVSFPMNHIESSDRGEGNINDFRMMFDVPNNYSIEKADDFFHKIEDFFEENREKYSVKTIDVRFSNVWGMVRVFLEPVEDVEWHSQVSKWLRRAVGADVNEQMSRQDVIKDVKENIPQAPGVEMNIGWMRDTSEDASVTVVLYGSDTSVLAGLSREVERRLETIPEIVSVDTDLEKGQEEIRVFVERDLAEKYGIPVQVIAGTLSYALRGIDLPEYHQGEKEVGVRVQLQKEDRETLDQLKNLAFTTNRGKEIPLSALTEFEMTRGFGEIKRANGKTMLEVKANTTDDNIASLYEKIDQAMEGFSMPRGYSWDKGERFIDIQESNEAQNFAMILAITFVFLLMGVLFESFILPLSIIVSIPFSFIGVYWLLYLTNTTFEIMAGIGLIILIGVVVNNAIVLIDLVNRLRGEGYSRYDAIIEAGRHRFRPILMTALTTIFGLMPMAVGKSSLIGIPYAPLGRTMIGGLITSTFLTLFVVPLFYTYFDDLRTFWSSILVRVFSRDKRSAGSPAAE